MRKKSSHHEGFCRAKAMEIFKKLTLYFDLFRTLYRHPGLCGASEEQSKSTGRLYGVDFKEKKLLFSELSRD